MVDTNETGSHPTAPLSGPRRCLRRRTWFQNRTTDLVSLFPAVSAPPRVPLYQADQADAIAQFGEQWPHTRAAVCRALLHARFAGPAARLQEYVSGGWRFAGMKHVHLVLEFLTERNSWVLDAVPELRANNNRLQAFLRVRVCRDVASVGTNSQ
ncbi:hypothetical protein HPB47_015131 [Ixodes persulcatus]|uniref:Uncharacterized protein n=1 Tax=Ixodes persulcatus TaxID=34615 RepID=A0AC60QXU0_IXOPE|nr:hypothetical protein HPB47_015131 [Ixodes persulcatus]